MADKNEKSNPDTDETVDGPKWTDLVKRVMSVGLGAAFMTEESVRSALSDLKLPKEVLTTLIQGANRSKEELMNKVGNETVKILSKIDFVKEASRFVEEHKFKITAEIDIVKKAPDDQGLAIKSKVIIKD